MSKNTMAEMVAAVKTHAKANYEKGWDFIIECYDDIDISDELTAEGCENIAEALAAYEKYVEVRNDRMKDIRAESF